MGTRSSPDRMIGPYRTIEELGRGSQGQVFLAEDTRLSRRVALKILSASFAPSPQTLQRFQREAEAASRLDHPGICGVYEAGQIDGTHYIAMRFVEGETLAKKIASASVGKDASSGETLAVEGGSEQKTEVESQSGAAAAPSTRKEIMEVVHLIERAARALHFAHEAGLIHRDIKPGNIMVTRQGDPIILDFGLARAEDSEVQALTHSGELLGTPAYMSPEQLVAHRIRLDRRTDVYSLGVTLYECLTLRRPYEVASREALYQAILVGNPPDPVKLNRAIPRELKVVLETALDKDRERRYQTALELAEDLRRVRGYEPILARPAGPVLRARRWMQRNPVPATILAFLVVGLAVTVGLLARIRNEQAQKDEALIEKDKALLAVQSERDAKSRALAENQELLVKAESLYLAAQASIVLSGNPALALLVALEATSRQPSALASNVLAAALQAHREERAFLWHQTDVRSASFSPEGGRILSSSREAAYLWEAATGEPVAQFHRPTGDIWISALAADGRRALSAVYQVGHVWDAAGRRIALLEGHEGMILSAAFSPDGRKVVTGSTDGTARIWETESGRPLWILKGGGPSIALVQYSADGRKILTAPEEQTYSVLVQDGRIVSYSRIPWMGETIARLWDAETGEELHAFRGHRGRVSAALSPDGKLAATGCTGGLGVRVWDVSKGEVVANLSARWRRADFLQFSPDSTRILSFSNKVSIPVAPTEGSGEGSAEAGPDGANGGDGTDTLRSIAAVWDARTGAEVARFDEHDSKINAAGFSPDGRRVVTGSSDRTAVVWDARSGERQMTLKGHEGEIIAAGFSPNGREVITASADATARLWDVSRREIFEPAFKDLEGRPARWFLSPDGSRAAAMLRGPTAGIWNTHTGEKISTMRKLNVPAAVLNALGVRMMQWNPEFIFSPNGRRVLSSGFNEVELWDAGTAKALRRLEGDGPPITAVGWSGDSSRVVTAIMAFEGFPFRVNPTPTVHIRNADNGRTVAKLAGFRKNVRFAQLSHSGHRVLTAGDVDPIRVWDVASGKPLGTGVEITRETVSMARLSPDGERFFAELGGRTQSLYDFEGTRIADLTGHRQQVVSAVFSADGRRLLTSSRDETAIIWDGVSGKLLFTLKGHTGGLTSAAFSGDGKLAVTVSDDRTSRVWDVESGAERMSVSHEEGVDSAAFGPDQKTVVTVSSSRVLRVWPLDLASETRRRKSRELTPDERDRFEIGTEEERKAYRRRWGVSRAFHRLDLAAKAGAAESEAETEPDPGLPSAWTELLQVLGSAPSTDELARSRQLAAAFGERARGDPVLLEVLSDVQAIVFDLRESVALLEAADALPQRSDSIRGKLEARRKALLPDLPTYASIDAALAARNALIPDGAEWRYWRGRKQPSPELEWTSVEFNDGDWEKGSGGFGYSSDAAEQAAVRTVLSDMRGVYTTLYVRHRFERRPEMRGGNLALGVRADDGCVAYVNGVEIGRVLAGNPGDRLFHNSMADFDAVEPAAEIVWPIDEKLLRDGTNVIALLALNRSITSTDLLLIPAVYMDSPGDLDGDRKRFEAFRAAAGPEGKSRLEYLEGRLLQRAEKHDEARVRFEAVLAMDRTHAEPYLRLAESLIALGDANRAQARLRDALAAGVSNPGLWDAWFQTTFKSLKKTPAEALAAFPSSTGALGRRGADLRWILESLARGAVRINCGGKTAYRTAGGVEWGRDLFFDGGFASATPLQIDGTDDQELYRTERWFLRPLTGRPGYRLPMPPGRYRVTLHFAEYYHRGLQRMFDVLIEGQTVLKDYQPGRVGFATAEHRVFEIELGDGVLDIELGHRRENPKLSALEVEPR